MSQSSIHAAHRAVAAIDDAVGLLIEQAPLPDVERATEQARAATGELLGWTSAEALNRLIVELVRNTSQAHGPRPQLDEAR